VTAPVKIFGHRSIGGGQAGFIQVCGFRLGLSPPWTLGDVPNELVVHTQSEDGSATALDTDRQDDVLYSVAKDVDAGGVATFGPDDPYYCDSPGNELSPNYVSVTARDLYHTHLVFKSDTAGSIWVTLKRAEWRWTADIAREDIFDATSQWEAPTNVNVIPNSGRATDAQADHGQPTWTQRVNALFGR
jgi:hypothetical protein